MNKNYILTGMAIAVCHFASAQFTITADQTPNPGDSFEYFQVVGVTPTNVFNTGPNQVWDFSGVTGNPVTINTLTANVGMDGLSFPNSTTVDAANQAGLINEIYYAKNSSGYSIVGQFTGSVRISYTDPREFLKFPMAPNATFSETLGGTTENLAIGQVIDRSGTFQLSADASGTLILPYGTVNNVMKVTNIAEYSDFVFGIPFISYADTVVTFYNATTSNFIASYSSISLGGLTDAEAYTYIAQDDLVTGIEDQLTAQVSFNVYPNPTSGHINIASSSAEPLNVRIQDVSGKVLEELSLSAKAVQPIDVSHLDAGIYLVTAFGQNVSSHTTRLIVH